MKRQGKTKKEVEEEARGGGEGVTGEEEGDGGNGVDGWRGEKERVKIK